MQCIAENQGWERTSNQTMDMYLVIGPGRAVSKMARCLKYCTAYFHGLWGSVDSLLASPLTIYPIERIIEFSCSTASILA